jgi:hypothetical protein
MLAALGILIRTLGLICGGHQAVTLESLALPQAFPDGSAPRYFLRTKRSLT